MGFPPHSALPIRGKTSKQQKLSTNLTPYKAYTNHWTNLRRIDQKEERIQPWGKGDLKHNTLKKKKWKRQRNSTQMKEQTRNTEVQINEEEIRKLPE